ncbi:MAG TPA: DNA-3-methyladenine glycosylase [Acidobacteriota bacterium]|nr:DNA-3-methyladenine glycosylase [Acidobacteriota bacterium]
MPQMSVSQPPDQRLRIDPQTLRLKEYPRSFFLRPTEVVAQELIGAWFARRYQGLWYGARIVETEAYLGSKDAAAHSWRGRRTPRVEPMYRNGGHLYIFFVYGMHYCANIVTQAEGIAEAVLIRAAEGPPEAPPKFLSGPAKLCSVLGITTASSGEDLLAGGDIRLFRRIGRKPRIGVTPRIGIDYAAEAKDWPLRFFDLDSPAVSGPRSFKKTNILRHQ